MISGGGGLGPTAGAGFATGFFSKIVELQDENRKRQQKIEDDASAAFERAAEKYREYKSKAAVLASDAAAMAAQLNPVNPNDPMARQAAALAINNGQGADYAKVVYNNLLKGYTQDQTKQDQKPPQPSAPGLGAPAIPATPTGPTGPQATHDTQVQQESMPPVQQQEQSQPDMGQAQPSAPAPVTEPTNIAPTQPTDKAPEAVEQAAAPTTGGMAGAMTPPPSSTPMVPPQPYKITQGPMTSGATPPIPTQPANPPIQQGEESLGNRMTSWIFGKPTNTERAQGIRTRIQQQYPAFSNQEIDDVLKGNYGNITKVPYQSDVGMPSFTPEEYKRSRTALTGFNKNWLRPDVSEDEYNRAMQAVTNLEPGWEQAYQNLFMNPVDKATRIAEGTGALFERMTKADLNQVSAAVKRLALGANVSEEELNEVINNFKQNPTEYTKILKATPSGQGVLNRILPRLAVSLDGSTLATVTGEVKGLEEGLREFNKISRNTDLSSVQLESFMKGAEQILDKFPNKDIRSLNELDQASQRELGTNLFGDRKVLDTLNQLSTKDPAQADKLKNTFLDEATNDPRYKFASLNVLNNSIAYQYAVLLKRGQRVTVADLGNAQHAIDILVANKGIRAAFDAIRYEEKQIKDSIKSGREAMIQQTKGNISQATGASQPTNIPPQQSTVEPYDPAKHKEGDTVSFDGRVGVVTRNPITGKFGIR